MQLTELKEALITASPGGWEEIAKHLGCHRVTLHKKLEGRHKFTAKEIIKMCEVLGDGKGNPFPLQVFLDAYGFGPDDYQHLTMSLPLYLSLLRTAAGASNLIYHNARDVAAVKVKEIEEENGL